MQRLLRGLLVVGLLSVATTVLAAGPCPICGGAASDRYLKKTAGQLARGVANAGLCWVELGHQPAREMKQEGGHIVVGLMKGVGHTGVRLLEGVGEIVTAPMPRAKDGHYTQVADDCPLGIVGVTDR